MVQCVVCASSQADSVNNRIRGGEALGVLAGEYGIAVRDLGGHKRDCLRVGTRRRKRHTQDTGVMPW